MLAVNRPITILMATLALSIFGWQSLKKLETSLLPVIEYPEFVIIAEYEGGSPEEIERSITVHLEEAVSSLPGLQDIVSSSRDGLSILTAQFHWDIDHRFTLLRIREKIDAVFDRFPKGTKRPYIMDFNPGSLPIMELILSGDADLLTLGNFARDVLKPRFSQIDGVAAATITGSPRQTVHIEMDPQACTLLGITADDIIRSVQANLPTQPISSLVRVGYAEYPLTVDFPLTSPQDLYKIPIENRDLIQVTLKDVAQVVEKPLQRHSLVYRDSTKSLLIQLFKESGASTVRATQSALELIDELTAAYPDMNLSVLKDRGEFVAQAISGLKQAILLGAGLAFIIILLFLQDFRYSLLLSTVIPVSLLFAFNALYLHGISLNIMTLGGLALGLGLIVDNGIVVVDSIFNEIKKERSPDSVTRGVKKVSRAITGSTLTTIAIFLPIVYVQGYAAVLFKQQALTISYTLLISLLAAIFLIPAAYHYFILRNRNFQHGKKIKSFTIFKPIYVLFQSGYDKIETIYHRGLKKALDHKKITLALLTAFFLISGSLFLILPKQYWPNVPSSQVEIKVAVPTSVPFNIVKDQTEKTIQNLEKMPHVVGISTRLVDPADLASETIQDLINSPGNYYVYYSIELDQPLHPGDFERNQFITLITLPYSQLAIYQPAKMNQGIGEKSEKNLIVYITGESTQGRRQTALDLSNYMESIDFISNVATEFGGEQTVKSVKMDARDLMFHQISPTQLVDDIILKTGRKQIGVWQEKLHYIPVIASWQKLGSNTQEVLLTSIHSPGKSLLRTEQLLSLENALKVREVKRVNRRQVASVSGNILAHKLGKAADVIKQWAVDNNRPGMTVSVAGESERIAESYRDLFLAFAMAVVLVYLILAAQFESFIHPLNIILTVPMGLAGAVLGLTLFQQSVNVISLMGIVMLIGIGVNDAIIKVDYMNYLTRRKKKSVRDAIMQTSVEKFRPVVMTTLTTIAAMLPMAFGFGGNVEMNQPLAITIIGGLSITTVVTLILTPVIYELSEKFSQRLNKTTGEG